MGLQVDYDLDIVEGKVGEQLKRDVVVMSSTGE